MDFLIKFKNLLKVDNVLNLKQVMKEKRFFPRIRCAVDVRCIDELNQYFDGVVVEASLYGMRMYTSMKLKPEETYTVEVIGGRGVFRDEPDAGNPIKMKVVWCKKHGTTHDYLAGLHYEDTRKNLQNSWVALLLQKYGVSVGIAIQKRRRIRIPADLPLAISIALDTKIGKIMDIGMGGMLIATEANVRVKEVMRFRIGPYEQLEPLFCDGRILHERYVPSTKKWVYGVLFMEMSDKQSHLLSSYLTELCLEQKE